MFIRIFNARVDFHRHFHRFNFLSTFYHFSLAAQYVIYFVFGECTIFYYVLIMAIFLISVPTESAIGLSRSEIDFFFSPLIERTFHRGFRLRAQKVHS